MVLNVSRIGQDVLEEIVYLLLLQRSEALNSSARTHEPVQKATVLSESITVRAEAEGVLPSHVFGEHRKDWPV